MPAADLDISLLVPDVATPEPLTVQARDNRPGPALDSVPLLPAFSILRI
jgi:hypothetical protein